MKRAGNERLAVRGIGRAVVCACFVVPLVAGAQSRISMGREEATQLYTAAGFQIVNDEPVNRCGNVAKPRVSFVDVNDDKQPDALFIDGDPSCYGFSGRYFALLFKEDSTWRLLVHGNGTVQALQTRTAGWLDLKVTDAGCARIYRYDGKVYKPATDCQKS